MPGYAYDSVVYKLQQSGTVISHYAKDGNLLWDEVLRYDNQGRVTEYFADGFNYRRAQYTYTGTDSFPSVIVDSFSDGTLIVDVLTRTSSVSNAGVRSLKYRFQYDVPGSGYAERYNVDFVLDAGRLVWSIDDDTIVQKEDSHFYTADGLLDSTMYVSTSLTTFDTSILKLQYLAVANPLNALAKLVFKNLTPFVPLSV